MIMVTREEALREARRLLKQQGVDTSEMIDKDVLEKIVAIWESIKPFADAMTKFLREEFAPQLEEAISAIVAWWESLPEKVTSIIE